MKHWFIGGFALLSAFGAAQQFYGNDFEGASVGTEWSVTGVTTTPGLSVTPIGSRQFLGQFNNDILTLSLTGLVVGETYDVTFDLFVINSWDGNDAGNGPDRFQFSADALMLMDTTFSNVEELGFRQAYPGVFGVGDFAAMTGADEIDTLGYNNFGNSVYKFGGPNNAGFSFLATASNMSLNWQASGLQHLGDESWGLDNVYVYGAVPEPATMTLLGGLSLIALRRKHKRG